jgi:hypothetical protein
MWLICFLLLACSNNPENHLDHINGYWEIKEVVFPNGSHKLYKYTDNIDYIKIEDNLKGFRKKLKPGINNTYFTSKDAEAITVKFENDRLQLFYSTPFSKWKETVLNASETELKLVNENNTVYLYKRYSPINLELDN